ncbi:MAG: hypothetical protein ACK5IJ_11530 [Mangrovibacterium sp.]
MKRLQSLGFVLLALPLLAYPFVMLANVMSLAGEKTAVDNSLLWWAMHGFVLLTSSYPISYVCGFISARKSNFKSFKGIIYPLAHMSLIVLFFYLWSFFQNN